MINKKKKHYGKLRNYRLAAPADGCKRDTADDVLRTDTSDPS